MDSANGSPCRRPGGREEGGSQGVSAQLCLGWHHWLALSALWTWTLHFSLSTPALSRALRGHFPAICGAGRCRPRSFRSAPAFPAPRPADSGRSASRGVRGSSSASGRAQRGVSPGPLRPGEAPVGSAAISRYAPLRRGPDKRTPDAEAGGGPRQGPRPPGAARSWPGRR